MSSLRIKKVWIDKELCTGHKLCLPEASGLIEMDTASDIAKVCEGSLKRTEDELRLLIDAAQVCPMSAIMVELANGTVIDSDDPEFQNIVDAEILEWCEPDSSLK